MPRFRFTVTRKEICERDFVVDAADVCDAEEKAIEAAADHEWRRSGNVRYSADYGSRVAPPDDEPPGRN